MITSVILDLVINRGWIKIWHKCEISEIPLLLSSAVCMLCLLESKQVFLKISQVYNKNCQKCVVWGPELRWQIRVLFVKSSVKTFRICFWNQCFLFLQKHRLTVVLLARRIHRISTYNTKADGLSYLVTGIFFIYSF